MSVRKLCVFRTMLVIEDSDGTIYNISRVGSQYIVRVIPVHLFEYVRVFETLDEIDGWNHELARLCESEL